MTFLSELIDTVDSVLLRLFYGLMSGSLSFKVLSLFHFVTLLMLAALMGVHAAFRLDCFGDYVRVWLLDALKEKNRNARDWPKKNA